MDLDLTLEEKLLMYSIRPEEVTDPAKYVALLEKEPFTHEDLEALRAMEIRRPSYTERAQIVSEDSTVATRIEKIWGG